MLTITPGWLQFMSRLAISWASANRPGATMCTRADDGAEPDGLMEVSTGTARTELWRGEGLLGAGFGSGGDGRLAGDGPDAGHAAAVLGLLRLVVVLRRPGVDPGGGREPTAGALSSRSSYSSYSSSSRPRYTMVFFMNEGDMPSPVE